MKVPGTTDPAGELRARSVTRIIASGELLHNITPEKHRTEVNDHAPWGNWVWSDKWTKEDVPVLKTLEDRARIQHKDVLGGTSSFPLGC